MKIKKYLISGISVLLGIFMLYAAYNHIAKPDFYTAMIPSFIPDVLAHWFSIIAEAGVGIALLVPKYRKYGALGFAILMLIFLPIHLWDLFRDNHAENPAVPTFQIACIRFVIQLFVIALSAWMYKNLRGETTSIQD